MASPTVNVGRYALGERIAAGGMATVHLGRLVGSAGFSRTVAIKRLHPHLCEDPSFTTSFADEARLVARIRHPNVVPTVDVVSTDGELLIVMEYVDGEALSALLRRSEGRRVPLPVIIAIVSEMLHGLHAAHEAKSESGKPLEIVHRDVSPQNVLVGADGVARLVDFGIARTASKKRQSSTGENDLKGKLSYMAPEQIRRDAVNRRTDIFAAGIVLWELLTGKRLFASDSEAATMEKILVGWVQPPSTHVTDLPQAVDDIVLRALDAEPNNRFATARDFAIALEDAVQRALGREVAAWVEVTAADTLATRRMLVARAEEAGSPRSTAISLTSEVPTTPRREEFSKPLLPTSVASSAAVTTVTEALPNKATLPTRPEIQPEPVTGPSLIVLPSSETALPGLPVPIVRPHDSSLESERTMTSWGEPLTASHRPSAAPLPPPPRRSGVDRIAYTIFGLAALVTLVVALSWSSIAPQRQPLPAFGDPTPMPTASPTPPPTDTVAEPPPPPEPTMAAPIPAPPPVTPPAKKPPVRPPIVKPAKTPCVAKLDPVSGKKIYQGDCD